MSLELDWDQRKAVRAKGPVLVQAGAGAGKTRTLVAKAAAECRKETRSVHIVTFTVAAAEEIGRRLEEAKLKAPPAFVGTLHAFCLSLIRWAGNTRELVDEEALELVMDEVAKRLRLKLTQKRMRELAAGEESMSGQERSFVGLYEKTLAEHGLLTYDGILYTARELLGTSAALPYWKKAIFLIDEVQDSSVADLDIYETLLVRGAELWMVGDLQQAIYSFRHAVKADVWKWCSERKFGLRELPTNYRSSQAVVRALNVINCDFRPRLEAKTAEGAKWGETTLLRASDELELLGKLKGRILRLLERYLAAPKEIAVLCRTNKECAQVASVLSAFVPVKAKEAARAERVPVRLWAALGFYRQPQSDWMACRYLRSAGADDAGELRAAAKAMTSVGHRIYPALFAIERTKSEWVKWMDLLLVPKAEQAWFIERMPEGWQSLSWDEIVMRLFEVPLAQEVGEGVTVTTIHSAKGREWRHVLLAFCDQQSYRPKNGAEEMRVFFVGASRAIETLTFLFSERRLDEFRGGTVAVAMHEALERLVQAGKEEKAKSGSDEQANIEPTNEG